MQVPQATGMPPKQRQHMQPLFMQAVMQSQQACSMSQHALSPLVQVTHTPSAVLVHSHLHMTMLQLHIIMPFIMQQQLHMLSQSMLHMFWSVPHITSSSQTQVIFMPPAHFSIFILQRVTIAMPDMPGIIDIWPMGIWPGMELPIVLAGFIIIERSNIIAVDIALTP